MTFQIYLGKLMHSCHLMRIPKIALVIAATAGLVVIGPWVPVVETVMGCHGTLRHCYEECRISQSAIRHKEMLLVN